MNTRNRDRCRTKFTVDGKVVSRYICDGPDGYAGDPVKYYRWEADAAGKALANALGRPVVSSALDNQPTE